MHELMLGQINFANYCPVISQNTIMMNSKSTDNIWQAIRMHYGFNSTGAHFTNLNEIRLEPEECPKDLYQCLVAFVESNT